MPRIRSRTSSTSSTAARSKAIVCTHAHDDHVRYAPELAQATGAPIWLHPDDAPLWELTHPGIAWDADLEDGQEIEVGGTVLTVIHTRATRRAACASTRRRWAPCSPATPSSTAVRARPDGRSPAARCSRVDPGPPLRAARQETIVHTGHGDDTTIGARRLRWVSVTDAAVVHHMTTARRRDGGRCRQP